MDGLLADLTGLIDPGRPWVWLIGAVVFGLAELIVGGFLLLGGAAALLAMAGLVAVLPTAFSDARFVVVAVAAIWVTAAIVFRRLWGARKLRTADRDPNLLDRDRKP